MSGKISARLDKVLATLNSPTIAKETHREFVKNTPIDTGYARNNTFYTNKSIELRYKYGEVLDAGRGYRDGQMRGSEQAPKGMTKPTLEYIRKYIELKLGVTLRRI